MAKIAKVEFVNGEMLVWLSDGRQLQVPLTRCKPLALASRRQLERLEILGDGEGIHWSELDQDLSLGSLVWDNAQGV